MIVQVSADKEFVDELKIATDEKTASKAFFNAALMYSLHLDMISSSAHEIASLKVRISVLEQTLENARSAAQILVDQVSQGDLL